MEKLITISKTDTVANRRIIQSRLQDKAMTVKLFKVVGPRYKERSGGYTRVLKAGFRYGDMAPMAVIELVDRDESAKGKDSGVVEVKDVEEVAEKVVKKEVKNKTSDIKEDAKKSHSKISAKTGATAAKSAPRKTQGK